jgi:hypothetical protein
MKTYPGAFPRKGKYTLYVSTGRYRKPLKGEFYLSGAIPTAYRAPNDLGSPYIILRPATAEELNEITCPHCGLTFNRSKQP